MALPYPDAMLGIRVLNQYLLKFIKIFGGREECLALGDRDLLLFSISETCKSHHGVDIMSGSE